ncbi:hypothetical protein [Spiroplasma endosymbiont of Polydrusus pterygomalis]|uniref:hypothetical protein n=1 Tax=Spiroplasma endosymbiont of Polydrusus pterygomalis TaxID=3139327 RepID=UPI003CCB4FAC
MKQFLILLSSITTLTISSNTFAIFNQNTTFTNNLQTNNNNDNQTSLFNNQYGYLSTSDWITNQSDSDQKFYSYDTNHANYLLSDGKTSARTLFIVNHKGELIYKKDAVIPESDKLDVNNTKQEMINDKKITTIKDTYNPYSKSQYSNTYFSGDNNWQYIQFGGIEKHIDISSQAGADKIENSNNLSESLGLYYIAKAEINNKIDKSIAEQLSKYFINQSSLKKQTNNESVIKIIDLIIDNNEIYKLIFNVGEKEDKIIFTNNDKNYSLNFVFDNDNNLIEIYYNKWNNININKIDINGEIINQRWTGDVWTEYSDDVLNFKLLNWSKYAKSWNEFITIYPKFEFNKDAFIELKYDEVGSVDINKIDNSFQTSLISNNFQEIAKAEVIDNNYNPDDEQSPQWDCNLSLQIWHDNNNINCKFYINAYFPDLNDDDNNDVETSYDVSTKIKEVNFYSIYNI